MGEAIRPDELQRILLEDQAGAKVSGESASHCDNLWRRQRN